MEKEDTRDYKEPCPQCLEVNWGITDECKFYCKSCHTVIEKTKDVDAEDVFSMNSKAQSLNRGLKRKKQDETGWEWYICEGFQFILQKQAEALQSMGVDAQIKDDVMCNLWRRYLQKHKIAYVRRRRRESQTGSENASSCSEPDSELEAFSFEDSAAETDEGCSVFNAGIPSSGGDVSGAESVAGSVTSVRSGSVDGSLYVKDKQSLKMSMQMTLAFCYLSLLWLRESITLTDLLRLVFQGHIPYVKSEQYIPEELKIYGPDIHIFKVQSFPEYSVMKEKIYELAAFLDLPRFPPITENCYLHPNVLCMKYLMEANLPDDLHIWTSRVAETVGLDDVTLLTFDPLNKKKKVIPYEVQAVALIIVALKLLFVLDDSTEWTLARCACRRNKKNKGKTWFDFKEWYKTMKTAIDQSQKELTEEYARYSWKSDKTLYYSKHFKSLLTKRKNTAKNLQQQFSKLAGSTPGTEKQSPSSFVFNWEDEDLGSTRFHGHVLQGITQQDGKVPRKEYWLCSLKKCKSNAGLKASSDGIRWEYCACFHCYCQKIL
uniref:TATA box-binding protein-associated factor RNA polymerase I subunit B n=1 Tax=Leptobrachium leishanense TaxID=445787 RepID=A0A8C5PRQ1_9ANUR